MTRALIPGLTVGRSLTTTLKVDLDEEFSPCRWGRWADKAAWILKQVGLRCGYVEVARTNRGYHVRLTCRPGIPPLAIVAVQAMLGSDWKREAFNLTRVTGRFGTYPAWTRGGWNTLFSEKRPLGGMSSVEIRDRVKERVLLDSIVSLSGEGVNVEGQVDHLAPLDSAGGHAAQPPVGDFPGATRPLGGDGSGGGHASGKRGRTQRVARTPLLSRSSNGMAPFVGHCDPDTRTEPEHGEDNTTSPIPKGSDPLSGSKEGGPE